MCFDFTFYCSVRCDVPKKVLKNGWEPVNVTGDGNCFFRSISNILTGSEDHHFLYKLALMHHGCVREHFYRMNVQVCCKVVLVQ